MALTANQRKSIVDYLVTNCSCWKRQGDREILNNLPDEKLTDLQEQAKKDTKAQEVADAARQGFTDEQVSQLAEAVKAKLTSAPSAATPPAPAQPAATAQGSNPFPWQQNPNAQQQTAPVAQPVTANEAMALLPAEMREAISYGMESANREKAALVNSIIANGKFPDESAKKAAATRFMTKSLAELRDLDAMIPKTPQYHNGQFVLPNYGGAAPSVNAASDSDVDQENDVLPLPRIDYDEAHSGSRKKA